MDLSTFRRPAARDTAAPPAPGDDAPAFPLGLDEPTVLVFLRHVGCPFAERTARDAVALVERRADAPRVVLVSHGSTEATTEWARAVGIGDAVDGERVRVLADPKRGTYADWGLGLTDAAHFAGPRALAGVASLLRDGITNRHPSGSRWQRAGAFAVADGRVAWRHHPADASDLPDLAAAVAALE
jgi:hypothetical protein